MWRNKKIKGKKQMKKQASRSPRRRTVAVLAALSLGAAPVAWARDLNIAYIQKQGDQQYFVDEASGAQAAANALGGVHVRVINVNTDSNAAISALSVVVGQKVDGIIIVVPDQQIGPQVIETAAQAHIPVLASDDPIKAGDGTAAPFVGFDSRQMGEKVGTEAGQLFKQAGWDAAGTRVLDAYEQQLSDCQERQAGEMAGFASSAGATPKTIEVGTDNSVVDAQNRTGAVVTANPAVRHWVVMGCNDENETGAVTALSNAGVPPANVIGVGLGAYLDCKDWRAGQPSGNKAALFISGHDVGATAVKVMVNALRGHQPLPPRTIAATTIVTPQTWQGVMKTCS